MTGVRGSLIADLNPDDHQLDNFEGLAIRRPHPQVAAGVVDVFLVSDNNASPKQRTLLYQLSYPLESSPPTLVSNHSGTTSTSGIRPSLGPSALAADHAGWLAGVAALLVVMLSVATFGCIRRRRRCSSCCLQSSCCGGEGAERMINSDSAGSGGSSSSVPRGGPNRARMPTMELINAIAAKNARDDELEPEIRARADEWAQS